MAADWPIRPFSAVAIRRLVNVYLHVTQVVTGMHSTSAPSAMRTARRASNSPVAHFLARAGLTARGVIYILVGVVAVLVALGQSSQEADQSGALQLLAGKSYGLVALWFL